MGKFNEVGVLALSPAGFFLVEIKSRPGTVQGDTHTSIWTTDGRECTYDNPLILADRKAERLASLLQRQPKVVNSKIRVPSSSRLSFCRPPVSNRSGSGFLGKMRRILGGAAGSSLGAPFESRLPAPRLARCAIERLGALPKLGQTIFPNSHSRAASTTRTSSGSTRPGSPSTGAGVAPARRHPCAR